MKRRQEESKLINLEITLEKEVQELKKQNSIAIGGPNELHLVEN